MTGLLKVQNGSGGKTMIDRPREREPGGDMPDRQANWQRHVMVVLWISILLLIVVSGALVYAKYYGIFASSPNQTPSVAPWPATFQGFHSGDPRSI